MFTSEYCEIRQTPTHKNGEKSTATYSQAILGVIHRGSLCGVFDLWM